MAINFPNSPQVNDTYTEGNRSWTWNGTYWRATSATIGYVGSRGYSGSIGYSGSQGDPGRSVIILGSVSSSATLPSPYTGDIGDGYITQDTGHLWVWDGSQFYDVGQVAGYTGSLGYTGSRGALDAWTLIDANTTATSNARYIADTSNGQFTLTLPANPTIGYYVIVTDGAAWNDTPLLVDGNGETIEGYTDPISLDITGITVEFIWKPDNWEVTATLGVRGDLGYTGSQGPAGEFAALGYTGSAAALGALDQSLIPDADDTYDLGSADYKWRSLYVGTNTIYLGTAAISLDETSGALTVTTAEGDPITVGGASVEVSATAPADPSDGNMWLDSTSGNFSVYVGGGWLKVGPGGGGSASVEVSGTAPSSPDDGNMWMNDETGEFSVYVGGGWLTIAGGGAGGGGGTSYDEPSTSTGYFGLPVGTTAQRPGSAAAGMVRYNSTLGSVEIYNTTGWELIGGFVTVSSVTPTSFSGAAGTQFSIVGSSFVSGSVVKFIKQDLTEYTATTTTFVNSTELLATTPIDFTIADEPLAVKVVNPNGASGTKSNAIDCGSAPAFVTAAGSLGNIYDSSRSYLTHLNPTAPDPDGGSVTYSITAGSLPAGLSFNTANATFSGTADAVVNDVTSTFTVQAVDSVGNTNTREFSITVKAPVTEIYNVAGSYSWTAPTGINNITQLIMLGGGGGGNAGYQAWGHGGAGAGFVKATDVAVVSGDSYILNIGEGGLGAIAASVTVAGSNGENTTAFTNTAYGGQGGQTGGGGTGGTYQILNGTNDGSSNGSNGGTGSTSGGVGGTNGGGATYGTGAAAVGNYTPGNNATGNGNGASGGNSSQNWQGTRSGTGSGGLISITY